MRQKSSHLVEVQPGDPLESKGVPFVAQFFTQSFYKVDSKDVLVYMFRAYDQYRQELQWNTAASIPAYFLQDDGRFLLILATSDLEQPFANAFKAPLRASFLSTSPALSSLFAIYRLQ